MRKVFISACYSVTASRKEASVPERPGGMTLGMDVTGNTISARNCEAICLYYFPLITEVVKALQHNIIVGW